MVKILFSLSLIFSSTAVFANPTQFDRKTVPIRKRNFSEAFIERQQQDFNQRISTTDSSLDALSTGTEPESKRQKGTEKLPAQPIMRFKHQFSPTNMSDEPKDFNQHISSPPSIMTTDSSLDGLSTGTESGSKRQKGTETLSVPSSTSAKSQASKSKSTSNKVLNNSGEKNDSVEEFLKRQLKLQGDVEIPNSLLKKLSKQTEKSKYTPFQKIKMGLKAFEISNSSHAKKAKEILEDPDFKEMPLSTMTERLRDIHRGRIPWGIELAAFLKTFNPNVIVPHATYHRSTAIEPKTLHKKLKEEENLPVADNVRKTLRSLLKLEEDFEIPSNLVNELIKKENEQHFSPSQRIKILFKFMENPQEKRNKMAQELLEDPEFKTFKKGNLYISFTKIRDRSVVWANSLINFIKEVKEKKSLKHFSNHGISTTTTSTTTSSRLPVSEEKDHTQSLDNPSQDSSSTEEDADLLVSFLSNKNN